MDKEKRDQLLSEYNHLLSQYQFIPQDQINNWVRKLITSQTKHVSELIVNFVSEGFFRARAHNVLEGQKNETELQLFTCESQFWNPPIELCKNRGRCNDINESLLYCASDLSTSVIETRPIKGQFITIAKFSRKKPETYKGARVKFVGLKTLSQIPQLKHILGAENENDAEKLELDETLDELFHKKVTKETENLYRLSIAVTKSMMATLYDPDQGVYYEMHGMLYSSIERNRKHFNIIYRPDHARQHFGVAQVKTFEVLENNATTIILRERRNGYMKSTRIMDPLDFYGINWQNCVEEKIIKIDK